MGGPTNIRLDAADERRRHASDAVRFTATYERCCRPITAFCARRMARDRVDDAVAEIFLVAWRRLDAVPEGREELLWLYRVAGNVIRHDWRTTARRRRLRDRANGLRLVTDQPADEHAVAAEERATVAAALERLDPADAEIMTLVAWEQLSPSDLAVVLDVSPNTASQRVSRARRRLARAFDEQERRGTRQEKWR